MILELDGGNGKKLYLDDEQKPNHLSLFMTFEVGFEHYADLVAAPWVHLDHEQARRLAEAVLAAVGSEEPNVL
jgi:hypothetical protein